MSVNLPSDSGTKPEVWKALAHRYLNQSELTLLKAPLFDQWRYENGCILKALLDAWKYTNDRRYLNYVKACIDTLVQPNGRIWGYKPDSYNLDNINEGKVLLELYGLHTTVHKDSPSTQERKHQHSLSETAATNAGDARYAAAIRSLMDQLKSQPRTASGGFWHKLIYPNQMWLDGIYMAGPFLARYARDFDESEWFDVATSQIRLIFEHTRDEETGLLYHAWDESREQLWADPATGCSPNFWGRAMGWFAMALVDVLEYLPVEHPQFGEVHHILKQVISGVTRVQDRATGLWYQVLNMPDSPGNYTESSCSSMFVYAIAKGVRLGYLERALLGCATRAYAGLQREKVRFDSDGVVHLTSCNAVAGLGGKPYRDGSYAYYIHEPVVEDEVKAVAAFIMASLEISLLSGVETSHP